MTDQNKGTEPGLRGSARRLGGVVVAALVAGALVGAAGLYVMEKGPGNWTAAAAPTAAAAGHCPADAALRAALDAAARGEVAGVSALGEPFDARAIAFDGKDGKRLSLADFAGRTLLVNLWATWCVPCRAEMPALDALQRRAGGRDFSVVPINVDLGDPARPLAFYAETNLTALPFFRDATMAAFNGLKAQGLTIGLPVSLLVDRRGCARAVLTGPAEWSSPDAAALIETMGRGGAPA